MDHHPLTTASVTPTTHPPTTRSATHPLRSAARKLVVLWLTAIAALIVTACISPGGNGDSGALDTPLAQHDMAYAEGNLDDAYDGQITRLYLAYFGREPKPEGLTYWRGMRRNGTRIVDVADTFAESLEFQNRYGRADNNRFVTLVFNNVLDRQPASTGLTYWTGVLDNGASRGKVMVGFSDSKEFIAATGTTAPPPPPPPPPAAPTVTESTTKSVTTTTKTPVTTVVAPVQPRAYTPTPVTYEQTRGVRALNRLSYQWEDKLRGWSIHFHSARTGYLGLTFPAEQRIDVYVRSDMSDTFLAHVVAHEIGHAVDVTHNSGTDRAVWQSARGIGWAPWWPTAYTSDFSTGAGDFAEAFAFSQIGSYTYYRSNLASAPSWSQRNLLATLANG